MANRFKISDQRFQKGFTYIGLLIAIVFFGLGSVGVAKILASSERGERERELLFVGNEFRRAIGNYYRSSPGAPQYPESLDNLLLDPRFPATRRYLRRIYHDPITGKSEWGLVKGPQGGIMGVFSLAEREPLKRAHFDIDDQPFEDAAKAVDRLYTYRDWQFVFLPTTRR